MVYDNEWKSVCETNQADKLREVELLAVEGDAMIEQYHFSDQNVKSAKRVAMMNNIKDTIDIEFTKPVTHFSITTSDLIIMLKSLIKCRIKRALR